MSSKYLPFLVATLALASLAGAIVLDALGKTGAEGAQDAWTAFLAFSGALLGLHIPAPAAGPENASQSVPGGSGGDAGQV